MSDKFTESMEVEAVGNLKPGDIGWGTCDGCEKNIHKFPGVLLQGVTQEAAKLLFEKVEVVPVGTKAKMAELEASNKELLGALDDLIDECGNAEDCGLIDWEVMGKAREIAHKMRGSGNE